jgi:cellulose synthase/poly-beta-1,6-N-acetylglucosamine synthase-like glycosyltransferase
MPAESRSAAGPLTMAIGVCTYNRGRAILRTLETLASLDPVVVGGAARLKRIVIVNNRSSDETPRVVEEFIAGLAGRASGRSGGIRFELAHEPTPGKTHAMRRFFREATEPVLAIIDDDTVIDRAWASAMLGLLEDEPRAGAVGGPVANVWESGPTRLARIYRRSLGDQLLGERRLRLDDPGSFLMGASTAYRRRAIIDSGWLTGGILECRRGEKIDCGEDAELCLRIRRAGWEVWYEPSAKMGHLIPARRQTATYLASLRESICRSEPWIRWMAEGEPASAWAEDQRRRARRRYLKTLLFDWRPTRRRVRVAERLGRVRGWTELVGYLRAHSAATTEPRK